MRKILFLVSENPDPPRNGVTIPVYHHIELLKGMGDMIDLVVVDKDWVPIRSNANGNSRSCAALPRNRVFAAYLEIFHAIPYFARRIARKSAEDVCEKPYDLIYYSPISMCFAASQIANSMERNFGIKPRLVAAISDVYTSVLRSALSSARGRRRVKCFVQWLRSFYMQYIERSVLLRADLVMVQTTRDKSWAVEVLKLPCEKVVVATNGVAASLFNVPLSRSKDVVFVGNLRAEHYVDQLIWFYEKIWLSDEIKIRRSKLHIYTSGAKSSRFDRIVGCDSSVILHDDFVDNLSDIYTGKSICLAPVFKDYGFINKVAEAMAAGLVVIGDKSAFNGIADAISGVNCIVANSCSEFTDALAHLLDNESERSLLGQKARCLATKNFKWAASGSALAEV